MKTFFTLLALAAGLGHAVADEKAEADHADAWTAFRLALKEENREKVWACFTAASRKELTEGAWGQAFREGQKLDDEDAVTVAGYLGFKDVAEYKAADKADLAWHILTAHLRDIGCLGEEVHVAVTQAGEKTTNLRFEKDDKLTGWLVMVKGEDGWRIDLPASRELTVKKGIEEDEKARGENAK